MPIGPTRRFLQRADVLTSPRKVGTNTPLKIYELLASGKPIVATRIQSHTQVLSEDVCYLANPEPAEFAGVAGALTDQASNHAKTTAARQLFDRRYSRERYVEKIRAVMERLG